jgi:hypothetical protein
MSSSKALDACHVLSGITRRISLALLMKAEAFDVLGMERLADEMAAYADEIRGLDALMTNAVSVDIGSSLRQAEESTAMMLKGILAGVIRAPEREVAP